MTSRKQQAAPIRKRSLAIHAGDLISDIEYCDEAHGFQMVRTREVLGWEPKRNIVFMARLDGVEGDAEMFDRDDLYARIDVGEWVVSQDTTLIKITNRGLPVMWQSLIPLTVQQMLFRRSRGRANYPFIVNGREG